MISKANKRRYVPVILLSLAVSVIGAGAVAFVRGILSGTPGQATQVIQTIHLIRPPPPPPDLPPPPPPPPEEKVVQVPDKQPDPTQSDDPPPGDQLGLDAEGSAGGDAFGLLGRKGGRDLLASGGSAFAWYAGLLKDQILEQLNTDKRARHGEYSLLVRVWVRGDGSIDHVRIVQGSGDRARDSAIESALGRVTRLRQAPPADMPEPISLRIVSRG